jgi:hypothetical protein
MNNRAEVDPNDIREKRAAARRLADSLRTFLEGEIARQGGPVPAEKPAHRVPFHWPPHPISYSYHLHPTDWRGETRVTMNGEEFSVQLASTPHGVFGRCEAIWLEAKGADQEQMLRNLEAAAEPLFKRQNLIARCLGLKSRFTGHIRDLSHLDLLKMLYCPDRDASHEAQTVIELHASQGVFFDSLLEILRDRGHAYRRSSQWEVLDLFENLESYCLDESDVETAVKTMRDLIWDAEDDYARTIYKAGVVLGGHLGAGVGGRTLIECLSAPSPIGRRSAIHGLFHVVEWEPKLRGAVVRALREASSAEPVPQLKEYAARMASDIERAEYDHVAEPTLPGED